MSQFPDFSRHGYRVTQELGANRSGGRVTYLATELESREKVVIKEFQFAKSGSTWAEYDSYKREIDVLRGLNHPGIPRYLNSFQTRDGFCMVQEYKAAQSLGAFSTFDLEEIRQIAIAVLQILVYLQNRVPPIIHRDLKPDNILVDDRLNVYLVDFGFARVGEGEIGMSSVVKGTLGFMPPEQLFNRQLTEASDLYGLGMTLICLLTGTKSVDVGNLVDITYKVNFKEVLPKISPHWIHWLERMVEPRLKNRFPNAIAALEAMPQDKFYAPDAKFSQTELVFVAKRSRQRLTQAITIRNPIPDTLLRGEWEVVPHPSDPPDASFHAWIEVYPPAFADNQPTCQVTVDTRQLCHGRLFRRQLRLHTNTAVQTYTVDLQVQTAPSASQKSQSLPTGPLLLLFGFLGLIAFGFAQLLVAFGAESSLALTCGAIAGAAIGFILAAVILEAIEASEGTKPSIIAGFSLGALALLMTSTGQLFNAFGSTMMGAFLGLIPGTLAGVATGVAIEAMLRRHVASPVASTVSFLTLVTASSLGIGLTFGILNLWVLLPLLGGSLPLVALVSYSVVQRIRLINDYRETQRHLIKP
ncbi:MAG TPA: serine/threonine protein kinase [Synechococcales cyanobacterium M55_K2018_004]|nr:serine/threonine protein kinase [Synechococcales cyanobacterium M55_K2018_004]